MLIKTISLGAFFLLAIDVYYFFSRKLQKKIDSLDLYCVKIECMKNSDTKIVNFKFHRTAILELERIARIDERDKSKFIRAAIKEKMERVAAEKGIPLKLCALSE